jgi:hypothetical protein
MSLKRARVCAAASLAALMPAGAALASSLEALRSQVEEAVGAGRLGEAVARCSDLPRADLDRPLRETCAQAAVALGDRLAASGQMSLARSRWEQALDLDPALADRADFMERLTLPLWKVSEDDAPPEDTNGEAEPADQPGAPADPDDAPILGRTRRRIRPSDREDSTPSAPSADQARPDWLAARGDVALGLGSGWYDGLLGLTGSVLLDGRFEALASIGLIYPTFDLRLRYHPFSDFLTPTFGFGLFIPFNEAMRGGGALLTPMEQLYALGDAFHVDAGATLFFSNGLAVSAMVSFVTTIDQDHPDAVVFHPQWTSQLAWHF